MNPNENHDSKLIAQIDHRIQNDQPTGIPILDDLAAAIPEPRLDFQQQLEDRLVAHYYRAQNGKGQLELVTHTPALPNRPQQKWAFIPLTLAAAMLAVVIIGSIILNPNRGGSQPGLGIVLQATASLTLSPTPVGTVLPNPAPIMGCDTPNATLQVPVNGMVVFEPINVIGTAFTDNFGFYRFELNGPSTSGNFAVIRDYDQPVENLGVLGQFVPSFYEAGDYQFRLTVFATDNSLRAACTINITVSEPIPTPTPIISTLTPIPLVNVVVALQQLPRGYQFPATIDELAGVVGYFPWPETALPAGALREDENGLEKVLGKLLYMDIFREQILLANLLVDDLTEIVPLPRTMLPADDKVLIAIPINLAEIAFHNINSGDQIDIIASIPYTNLDEYIQQIPSSDDIIIPPLPPADMPCTSQQPCFLTQALIHQATVFHLGDFNQTADVPLDIATLAVSPQDATIITWLLDAKIPFILRPSAPDPLQLPSHPGLIPTGMWLSEIAFDQITGDTSALQQGNLVDIAFSFLWQNVEPEMSNTSIPENGRVFRVTILHGVKVYKLGESIGGNKNDIVTLLLTEEDMALLSSMLKTTVPFAITLTQSNRDDLFLPNRADSHFIVEIPIGVLSGEEGLLEKPNTVNILAQVDFNGYAPSDPNAFQLEGKNPVVQVVVRNAGVVDYDTDFFRIAVTPEDLPNLQWALKAGIPLTLQLPE